MKSEKLAKYLPFAPDKESCLYLWPVQELLLAEEQVGARVLLDARAPRERERCVPAIGPSGSLSSEPQLPGLKTPTAGDDAAEMLEEELDVSICRQR